jgi:hypothetical protein
MDQAFQNDYAGIIGWSYRAGDSFSFLKDRGNDIDHWRATHPIRLQP